MDREITLREYARVAWAGRWLILATTAVAIVIGLLLTVAKPVTYRATSRVFLGQATSPNGVPIPTPYTTPVTAAAILKADELVDATVTRLQGVSGLPAVDADRVRDAVDFTIQRTAGATTVNQPTVATVVVVDRNRRLARETADAYAEAVEAKLLTFYEPQAKIRDERIADLTAREAEVEKDLDAFRGRLAGGNLDATGAGILLQSLRDELSEIRRDISEQELESRKAEQAEKPQIVNRASTPSSSGGVSNRLQRTIFAGLLGFILGLIATFAWKGSPAGRAAEAER